MKTPIHFLLLSATMLALAANSQTYTYTDLHNFPATSGTPTTNSDGSNPYGGLISSSNVFYGTTYYGGPNGVGSIYSIQPDGSGFSNLYAFSRLSSAIGGTNSDGGSPSCPLLLSGNVLFGTANLGGAAGGGAIFRVDIDGSHYTNLHSFPLNTGQPRGEVILSSNVLYGTATTGGAGYGSVFRINTDGTDFTNIVVFTGTAGTPHNPYTGLALANGVLYGGTEHDGFSGSDQGVIFAVSTDGTGYTNIFTFQPLNSSGSYSTNSTGANPFGTLVLSGDTLYGTAEVGGANGSGVVFSLGTNGSNFNVLYAFSATTNNINSDGAQPFGALLLTNGLLYGTTSIGGPSGKGTVFLINTNGSSFTTLYQFVVVTNNSVLVGGYAPVGGLLMSGYTLYGTTLFGGTLQGNIYSLSLPQSLPVLNFQVVNGNLVLSWSDPAFSLQTSPQLGQAFVTITNSASPYTTNFSGVQRYFRLKQN